MSGAVVAEDGDGRRAAEEARMDDAPHVPELQEESAARRVYGGDDRLPGLDLFVAPDAGRVGPAETLPA